MDFNRDVEEWAYKRDEFGQHRVSNAWYTLAQEFQSGDTYSQDKAIFDLMKQAWDAGHKVGFEQGDYIEGWEEGYKSGRRSS